MHKPLKIIVLLAVLVGALFLANKYFGLNLFSKQVCPDPCTYTVGVDTQNIQTVSNEEGRIRQDFGTKPPIGFPPQFPIDPKPLSVINSYIEVVPKSYVDNAHKQMTYTYITSQSAETVSANFQKYLEDNNYAVTVGKTETGRMTYTLHTSKIFSDTAQSQVNHIINISAVTQNQFESMVTVSMIVSDITKN